MQKNQAIIFYGKIKVKKLKEKLKTIFQESENIKT